VLCIVHYYIILYLVREVAVVAAIVSGSCSDAADAGKVQDDVRQKCSVGRCESLTALPVISQARCWTHLRHGGIISDDW